MMGGLPKVLVAREAYQRMLAIVDIADKEVGWLGTATQQGRNFLIEEIFLFRQEVSAVTTEISPEGLAEVAQEILTTRPEDGVEVLNNLRFWGHSHVRMGTSPSGQDEAQMAEFAGSGHPWFIRGILNKLGRMEFSLFLYQSGVKILDAEWEIVEPSDEGIRADIEAQFREKVAEFPQTPLGLGGFGHSYLKGGRDATRRDEELEDLERGWPDAG